MEYIHFNTKTAADHCEKNHGLLLTKNHGLLITKNHGLLLTKNHGLLLTKKIMDCC